MAFFKTHYYGGIKKYQWLTIPLALHGIVCRADGQRVEVSIGDRPGDPVFTITDLLPHLAKDQMVKKLTEAVEGEQLNLLAGGLPLQGGEKDAAVKMNILTLLHQNYGITEEDFVSAELEVVPAGPAYDVGLDRSMVGAYGQDDRVCVYTSLRAILETAPPPAPRWRSLSTKRKLAVPAAPACRKIPAECRGGHRLKAPSPV
ncbi:hypothetical protein P378_15785 [Desulforamulus profundi]|uniref:M18 family aminopeptidase n=1 Tax=Desulforamulus profundi TaxID=1383067 RepID=A0A2C6MBS0_9FIRM|nr:hypothetical protein P378_15785 [Desulforamulus profundi]